MSTYADFDLEMGPAAGGASLEVRSFDRPATTQETTLPLSWQKEDALVARMEERYRCGKATGGNFHVLGKGLFHSLLPGNLEGRFRQRAEAQEAERVRIRISFEEETGLHGRPLGADLPWEALVDPRSGRYLFQQDQPIVRYLDLPLAVRRFEVQGPLRVLLVAPDPNMAKGEKRSTGNRSMIPAGKRDLQEFFATAEGFQAEVVSPPTFKGFQEKLRQGDFHIIHFLGHGGFHAGSGQGALHFEAAASGTGGRGRGRPLEDTVLATTFAQALAGQRKLRLVVLSSCRTAWSAGEEGQDPLRGVASALLAHEVPAVVGMRFNFRQDAALAFSKVFYQHLARTGQVDGATCAGRRALFEHDAAREQWLIPVLYSRAAHGQIFDTGPSRGTEEPFRIGIRSFFGWGTKIEEWSDSFLPLTCFFRGRYLKEPTRWPEIHMKLKEFLGRASEGRGHLHLDFAAHCTLAFATGRFLEAKSEHAFTIQQRGRGDVKDWPIVRPREKKKSPDFAETEHEAPGEGQDRAFVVAASRNAFADVKAFVDQHLPQVGQVLEFSPAEGGHQFSVEDGPHASQLASQVVRRLEERAAVNGGVVHLFLAVPNGLAFALGCFSLGPRFIQLYEFDFDGLGNKSYTPSLRFPPLGP